MRVLFPACLALLALANSAHADVADPHRCTVPEAFVVCPAGDLAPRIVVRNFGNHPIAGSSILVDLGACPSSHLCPDPFPDPSITLVGTDQIAGTTHADGALSMPVRMTGGCWTPNGSEVHIYADGILLSVQPNFTLPPLASTDQNGDLAVDAADEAILTAKIAAGTDRTADLDANGVVDNADLDVLHAHTNHVCSASTPTRRSRWGQLKLLYR